VSTLLLSAVHPVALYTPTQPSTASRELCGTSQRVQVELTTSSSSFTARRPQHSNVNDATLHTTVLVHQ
jgi:hypothetical protein